MLQTNANTTSLKEIRKRDKEKLEADIKAKCEAIAIQRIGSLDDLLKLSNANKGIWYLPVIDDDGEIEKMAVCKPIDRGILSYASTKMEEGGLYDFLECAMREVIIEAYSDMEIITVEEYFLPASGQFNKIIEGKKAYLLKR